MVHDTNASKNDFLFDKENLSVYKKIYNNFTDLDGEEKKILRKRMPGTVCKWWKVFIVRETGRIKGISKRSE